MQRATILSILVASLGLAGCMSTPEEGAVDGLAQGLTVLDAEVGTLSLAYRSGDVVIYMESLRGENMPEVYQTEEAPRFQMDALFTDADGYVFYSQQGGDNWLDWSWGDTLNRQVFEHSDAGSNEVLFRLSTEAAATLREDIEREVGPEMAALLEPEIRTIDDFASRAAGIYEQEFIHYSEARQERSLPELQLEGADADVAYGTNGPEDSQWTGGSGYYYIDIRTMGIYADIGDHSATSQYRWMNSAWQHVHSNCNHGDCALTMARKCLHQYYETNDSDEYLPSYTAATCSTGYNAWSDSGGHNCHDDTRVQTRSFINGGTSPLNSSRNNMWCNGDDDDTDISVDIWGFELDQEGSPDCSSSGHRGYNFSP